MLPPRRRLGGLPMSMRDRCLGAMAQSPLAAVWSWTRAIAVCAHAAVPRRPRLAIRGDRGGFRRSPWGEGRAEWTGGVRGGVVVARGSMTVEAVMLAPVFLLFLMFLVGAGRVVEAQGEVNGAARDAARAASVQRTLSGAEAAARDAAQAALGEQCPPQVSMSGTEWREGGVVRATVTCELDLDFLGFGTARQMEGSSVVPL